MQRIKEICKNTKIVQFSFLWVVFALVLFLLYYDARIESINTTSLAFSYEYGFISRGLIGTIFSFVDKLLPIDMYQYHYAYRFSQIGTAIFFLILFIYVVLCIIKSEKIMINKTKYISLFFSLFAIPMFITEFNLGRYDVYCLTLSLIAAILIICEKAECLVVVFSALGVMIHQGNVFMFLNIILILLLYKAFSYEGKKRTKYFVLFSASLLIASVLFLYFEFFSRTNGASYVDQVGYVARLLGDNSAYHKNIISHEILGLDLSKNEAIYKKWNLLELIIFVVFTWPYILLIIRFFINVVKRAEATLDKWKYFFVAVGAGTILPSLILKCDFGRWVFVIVAYYSVIILALLAMNDKIVSNVLKDMIDKVKHKKLVAVLLFVYPLIFQPLQDVRICDFTFNIAEMINDSFLHWW